MKETGGMEEYWIGLYGLMVFRGDGHMYRRTYECVCVLFLFFLDKRGNSEEQDPYPPLQNLIKVR